MKVTALDQMRNCIIGPDAAFKADITECIDYLFDTTKKWPQNPNLRRLWIENLVDQAIEYGRRTTSVSPPKPASDT